MSRFANSNHHATQQMSQIRHRRQPHAPAFIASRRDREIFSAPVGFPSSS